MFKEKMLLLQYKSSIMCEKISLEDTRYTWNLEVGTSRLFSEIGNNELQEKNSV